MLNVEQTIISQYANSPTLTQLVRNMDRYIDPLADIDTFYSFVWDVETAQGFGLDIWGRIVGVKRELTIPGTVVNFGFKEAIPGSYPFGEQPFYAGDAVTQTYTLSNDAYRTLIYVKALANISSTNSPTYNQLLQNLFAGRGRCYVNDLGSMQMRFTFEFQLTDYEFAIMTQSGVMPRPAGVSATILQAALPMFGFAESGTITAAPFNQGVFLSQGAIHAII